MCVAVLSINAEHSSYRRLQKRLRHAEIRLSLSSILFPVNYTLIRRHGVIRLMYSNFSPLMLLARLFTLMESDIRCLMPGKQAVASKARKADSDKFRSNLHRQELSGVSGSTSMSEKWR